MFEYLRSGKYKAKENKKSNNSIINLITILIVLGLIGIDIRFFYISTTKYIDGIDIEVFAESLSAKTKVLPTNRGIIYDTNGHKLAYDINTYTLLAYLDEERSINSATPQHVVNKQLTAEALAPILNTSKEEILRYLNPKKPLYQTYFGISGANISEIQKSAIVNLGLPGLDFIKRSSRSYPLGVFSSYEIGYSKYDEQSDEIYGELGVEEFYNEYLRGKKGSVTYVGDRNGFKIAGTSEQIIEPSIGKDVYLTIDKDTQLIVESVLNKHITKDESEILNIVVADVATGEIIASSTRPSFDPNIKNMELYLNPLVSLAFEPGSTMKIYTYAAAMNEGLYNGKETFKSGSYEIDGYRINDWNRVGWGEISYDKGFTVSSNVAVTNLALNKLGRRKLEEYFYRFGFGNRTEIGLPLEESGNIDFLYDVETANASFGQGITTTPIQHIQALLTIANDGVMKKSYIVKKIVDPMSNKILFENVPTVIDENVVSKEVALKIRDLMWSTVNEEGATAHLFKVGDELIGKTGTAQIASGSSYSDDETDLIYSFSGMYPKDNPQFVIYAYLKRPQKHKNLVLVDVVKDVVSNLKILYGIDNYSNPQTIYTYKQQSCIGKNVFKSVDELKAIGHRVIVLGDGSEVIDQYPKKDVQVSNNELIILKTYSENYQIPNFNGLSRYDIISLCNMLGIKCEINGSGYAVSQSIPAGTIISEDTMVTIELEQIN